MPVGQFLRLGALGNLVAIALGSTGCEHMNNTETGAAVGAGTGAVLGTAVGAMTGRPLAGAAIGAAAGTGVGALAGNSADRSEQRIKDVQQAQAVATAQAQAQAQQQRMGMSDVIAMSQNGHNEQVIINQIRATGSSFQLTTSDLDYLKKSGVSDRVIAEMQVARESVPVVAPGSTAVIYGQPYPPPVYVRPAPVVVFPMRPYYGGYYGGYYRRW